jgi:SAM-dependent methyltransferase
VDGPVTSPWAAAVRAAPTAAPPLWRTQSDLANGLLLDRWLPQGLSSVLKTDLFDECVADGLYPALAGRAGRVAGIDVDPAVVSAAASRHPRLEASVADVRALPFADASFDAVVSNSTLDHLHGAEEVSAALREIHRVLRPGAPLVVTLDNPLNPLVALRNAAPAAVLPAGAARPYVSAWTCRPGVLRRLLRSAGLEVRDTTAIVHFPRVAVASAGARTTPRARAALRSAEALGRWPTRFVTGHFIAALAVRA